MSISAKRLTLALAVLAAACDKTEPPPAKQRVQNAKPAPPPVEFAKPPVETPLEEPGTGDGQSAATVLERYFALIEAGRYEDARQLRESGARAPSAEAFAANFERYAEHHASVGSPSLVAEAGEWLYVEVPVQRYGKFRDGKTFANAGTVTLRRRKSGGDWRIFTSG